MNDSRTNNHVIEVVVVVIFLFPWSLASIQFYSRFLLESLCLITKIRSTQGRVAALCK